MFVLRPSVTRVGVVFSFSLCLVSSCYMLYLQKYEGVDFKKDAKDAVEDFSLFELFPSKSPFGRGDNWPFTPIDEVKPHPKYNSGGELQSSAINKLQSGKLSLASMFLPPSMRQSAELESSDNTNREEKPKTPSGSTNLSAITSTITNAGGSSER